MNQKTSKNIKNIISKYLPLFILVIATTLFTGITDNDYYMDVYLGKEELLHHNFSTAVYGLQFGTAGNNGLYLDHEWLYNIFVYILSLTGKYHILITNIVIHLLFLAALIIFIREFDRQTENDIGIMAKYASILLFTQAVLVKAYTVGLISVMILFVLIHRYKDEHKRKYLVIAGILLLLTANIHSSTYLIEMAILGVLFVIDKTLRAKETVAAGLCYMLLSVINPYGIKLIIFDLQHYNDPLMKRIVGEWQSAGIFDSLPIILMLLFFNTMFVICSKEELLPKLRQTSLIFLLAVLSVMEKRHIMFFMLYTVATAIRYDYGPGKERKENAKRNIRTIAALIIFAVLFAGAQRIVSDEGYTSYCNTLNEKDAAFLRQYERYNICSMDFPFTSLGMQSFMCQAFPVTRERAEDWAVFWYGDTAGELDHFTEKYDIHAFLIGEGWEEDTLYEGKKIPDPAFAAIMASGKYKLVGNVEKQGNRYNLYVEI